ncbi:MAG: tetratricopeptide repeat protein [Bacteroidia bacterium]|nr:tetratricopeptide repeat protein [Bacteroidia bacterium]
MNMKRILYIVSLVLTMSLPISAQNMKSANDAYAAGNYEEAIQIYENVTKSGYESSTLYFNLGNAYYRTGKLAPSILNYERALRLDADNVDAQHNLEFVRQKTVDKIEPFATIFFVKWIEEFRNIADSNEWAYTGIIFLIILIISLFLYIFGRRIWIKKTGFGLAIATLCFTVVSLVFSYQQKKALEDNSTAIVFVPTVTIKSSPDNSGTDLFVLHEGTKLTIKSILGDWSEITTEDGNTGWILSKSIEKI